MHCFFRVAIKLSPSVCQPIKDLFLSILTLLMILTGGTACVYCGQPLDTIKVKLQTFPGLYSGPISCLRHTVRTEGLQGLYKGSVPALVCNVSENAVLFVALGAMKKLVASLCNSHPDKLRLVHTKQKIV